MFTVVLCVYSFFGARALACFQSDTLKSSKMLLGSTTALALAILVSSLLSSFPDHHLTRGYPSDAWPVMLAQICFFALILFTFTSFSDANLLINALLIGSIPTVFYAIVQMAHLDPFHWQTDGSSPLLSTQGRSNFFGSYLAAIFPFLLLKSSQTTPFKQLFRAAALIYVLLIFLTLSRGAWLALIFPYWYWHQLYGQKPPSRKHTILSFLLLVAGLFLQTKWKYIITPEQSLLPQLVGQSQNIAEIDPVVSSIAIQQRFAIWRETIHFWIQRPLIGYGFGAFPNLFATASNDFLSNVGLESASIYHPHNVILFFLISGGVIAFISFMFLIYYVSLTVFRSLEKNHVTISRPFIVSASASLMSILISSIWNPMTLTLWVLFWLGIALIAIMTNNSSTRVSKMPDTSSATVTKSP